MADTTQPNHSAPEPSATMPAREPRAATSAQTARLIAHLHHAGERSAFYRRKLVDSPNQLGPSDWASIPFTTRAELEADQLEHPPYGSIITEPLGHYTRLHQTSGSKGQPLRWLDTPESWGWFKQCWLDIYAGAEIAPGDVVLFPFSFGPFIGFWAAFEAGCDLGLRCLPAGGMTTVARLRYLLDHSATVVCCTPTYAMRMAECAAAEGIDLARSTVKKLIVAGEPGGAIPTVRATIESAWGARVFDHAGMTEMGAWGFECAHSAGSMHINEDEFVAEIIDPTSQAALPPGEIGELVLTNLGRLACPLIRYRTGDLARIRRTPCACGRSFARVEGGLLGRIDDMVHVRGNNCYPAVMEDFVRRFTEVDEFACTIRHDGPQTELEIAVEPRTGVDGAALAGKIASAFRDHYHFQATVRAVAYGTLPRSDMKSRRWTTIR